VQLDSWLVLPFDGGDWYSRVGRGRQPVKQAQNQFKKCRSVSEASDS